MKNVLIRRGSVIAAVAILFISIAIKNMLAAQKEPPKKEEGIVSAPLVKSRTLTQDSVATTLNLTGRLIAQEKIDVYAEVTGRLSANGSAFREGQQFQKGQAILTLDNREARMNLIASRASFQSALTQLQADLATDYPDNFGAWSQYISNFDPEKPIAPLPTVTNQKEKNLLVSRNVYNQYYAIRSQEVQLEKFTVRAPFTGVVYNANITPGTLVRSGQLVGQFISTQSFELEVGVSLADFDKVRMGAPVYLNSEDLEGSWQGTVTRISQGVDQATQTFKVYVGVESEDLSEGMYLNAALGGESIPGSAQVPTSLLVDGNHLYFIEGDTALKKLQVDVLHESNGMAVVKGFPNGSVLLNQSLPNAKNGLRVRVKTEQN